MHEILDNLFIDVKEEKSVYNCYLYKISSIKHVKKYLNLLKIKYSSCNHICYAYRYYDNTVLFEYSSDSGEPRGSAGKPMLNELKKREIINSAVFVVRYFGGKKIGITGLIDIYSRCVKKLLLDSKLIKWQLMNKIKLEFSYKYEREVSHILLSDEIEILSSDYKETVIIIIQIVNSKLSSFLDLISNRFNNKILATKTK
tara:strand:- start:89 stop:688 length:600 start_codon:yes stop_codon:yes gene_type:complete